MPPRLPRGSFCGRSPTASALLLVVVGFLIMHTKVYNTYRDVLAGNVSVSHSTVYVKLIDLLRFD